MLPATSGPSPKQLNNRFAQLRRRFRFVVTFRGVSWFLALLCATAALGGLLDWHWHLPGLVRALLLVGSLAGAGLIVYRSLFLPLAAKADDLALALRVEKHYPGLNDSLASTVQFLEHGNPAPDSPSLRRMAIQQALRQAQGCDFNLVIDSRGLFVSGLSMFVLGAAAITLALLFPNQASTALTRLANPFGDLEWPRQTQLEIFEGRARIGQNEAFEIHGLVHGVIPESASVTYQLDSRTQAEQVRPITPGDGPNAGSFSAKLEPGRAKKSFSYQVRANDATSDWRTVSVVPPPTLVPLDGQASPQVTLRYPAYTCVSMQQLPPGVGSIEAVLGTRAMLRAAADRPLRSAWIEYVPQFRHTDLAAMLAPLGNSQPLGHAAATVAAEGACAPVQARLESSRQIFSIEFLPWITGTYVLHFEDESGLSGRREFELRILPDPAPTVRLERPSPSRESLSMLPGAEFTLDVFVSDPTFAVRSAYLEYRCKKTDPPGRLPLYDYATTASVSDSLGMAYPRQQEMHITQTLSLAQFKHGDRGKSALKEGDVLILQVCADDFDDVTVDKAPGRSHEVEIRIVGRTELERQLNEAQAKLEQELLTAREHQRGAIKKVADAQKQLRRDGKLTSEQAEALLQAEQTQQQIRDKIGDDEQKGMRAEVERIRQTLKDNHLPRTATHERMEALSDDLKRLATEELNQVEPRLTEARKLSETPDQKPELPRQQDKLLAEAQQHQNEVEKTLTDLLQRLEPWSSAREVKGEAQSILQEQQRLRQETDELKKLTQGKDLESLPPKLREELKQLESKQQKLQQQTDQLLGKMDRLAEERKKRGDTANANELTDARKQATDDPGLSSLMQKAKEQVAENKLNDAAKTQQQSIDKLQKLAKTLEDKREAELKRTADELRKKQKQLEDLADKQEQLAKKVKEAGKISDPQKREEELKRLAREQADLHEQAEELLKQLTRMRGGARAGQALSRAGEQMQQAGNKLNQGKPDDGEQDEALDRINDAVEELQQAKEEAEEQLAREQLAKIAELLAQLNTRHEALMAEADRIQTQLQEAPREQRRGLLISLGKLSENQELLGEETGRLAEDRLADGKVFAKLLKNAADAMQRAAASFKEHKDQVIAAGKADSPAGAEAVRQQSEALRVFKQLLDALKMEPGLALRPPQGGGERGGGGGGGGAGGDGDSIPPLVQLKLLRNMQAALNDRTEAFGREHPDTSKLKDQEKVELQQLRRDQKEVSDLLDDLMQGADNEEEKPMSHRIFTPGAFAAASLFAGLPPDAPKDAPDEPPRLKKKNRPPQENPGDKLEKPKVDPDKPDKDEKLKDADPEPGDGDPEAEARETLGRIDRNLRSVDERLTNKDVGDGTRQLQRDILKDFDSLIEQQKQQSQQQSANNQQAGGPSSESKPDSKNSSGRRSSASGNQRGKGRQSAKNSGNRPGQGRQPGQGDPSGQGDQPRPASASNGNGNQGGGGGRSEQRPDPEKLAEMFEEVWGHLDPKLRAEMNAYSREELLERYPDLVKQYRITIAKKGARKETDK